MSIDIRTLGDIAGRFDISPAEAQRIADTVEDEATFVTVWEDTEWWTDKANAFKDESIVQGYMEWSDPEGERYRSKAEGDDFHSIYIWTGSAFIPVAHLKCSKATPITLQTVYDRMTLAS